MNSKLVSDLQALNRFNQTVNDSFDGPSDKPRLIQDYDENNRRKLKMIQDNTQASIQEFFKPRPYQGFEKTGQAQIEELKQPQNANLIQFD